MFSIEKVFNKIKITISDPGSGRRGFSVKVKDYEDVKTALNHYLGQPHKSDKCPFCSTVKKGEK